MLIRAVRGTSLAVFVRLNWGTATDGAEARPENRGTNAAAVEYAGNNGDADPAFPIAGSPLQAGEGYFSLDFVCAHLCC